MAPRVSGSGAICLFCGWRSPNSSTKAMEEHYIAAHMQGVIPSYNCPWCNHGFYSALTRADHLPECARRKEATKNASGALPAYTDLKTTTNKETPNLRKTEGH